MKETAKKACSIGGICLTTYLASYIVRNILSVSTPRMITEAFFTKEYTGLLASVYFIFYAIGQLINGFIGDRVHPKYMIPVGLGLASVASFAVPAYENRMLHFICFAVMGFGLSMLRGSLMKVISENTEKHYARVICTLFSMVAIGGPLIAGLLSMLLPWRAVFVVAGILTVVLAAVFVIVIAYLERRGNIRFTPNSSTGFKDIFGVFKLENFLFYTFISAIGEVVSTSVNFWIPTYTTEYLGFSADMASAIYSVISFSSLIAPFLTLVLYEKYIHNGPVQALIMASAAMILFAAVRLISVPAINIALFLAAKIASSCAAGIVWSVYIPGLGKSGRVSSANGVIDALGYGAASLANVVFSGLLSSFGWTGVMNSWFIVMLISVVGCIIKLAVDKICWKARMNS